MKIALIMSCVLLIAGLSAANASQLTFQFSATITQVPIDEVFGDIDAGDSLQGSFTFDTSAVDLIPGDPSTGSYAWNSPFGMTATVGSHTFNAAGLLNIGVLNAAVDQYTVLAMTSAADVTLELFLQDNTGTAFTNDHLPLSPPNLLDFAQKDFHLDAIFPSGEVQADGQLRTLSQAATPEPGAASLLVGGLLALAVWGRRKRTLQPIQSEKE